MRLSTPGSRPVAALEDKNNAHYVICGEEYSHESFYRSQLFDSSTMNRTKNTNNTAGITITRITTTTTTTVPVLLLLLLLLLLENDY